MPKGFSTPGVWSRGPAPGSHGRRPWTILLAIPRDDCPWVFPKVIPRSLYEGFPMEARHRNSPKAVCIGTFIREPPRREIPNGFATGNRPGRRRLTLGGIWRSRNPQDAQDPWARALWDMQPHHGHRIHGGSLVGSWVLILLQSRHIMLPAANIPAYPHKVAAPFLHHMIQGDS